VKGRILDVAPSTARKIGISKHDGVAKVKVDPIAFPIASRSEKSGIAAKKTKANKPTSAKQRK
jgi:rare lipoprotein A (peptidoglycan hydrolase)